VHLLLHIFHHVVHLAEEAAAASATSREERIVCEWISHHHGFHTGHAKITHHIGHPIMHLVLSLRHLGEVVSGPAKVRISTHGDLILALSAHGYHGFTVPCH